jgi:hypothetical protein
MQQNRTEQDTTRNMGTTFDAANKAFNDDESRRGRVLMWMAHLIRPVIFVSLIANIPFYFGYDGFYRNIIAVIFLIPMMVGVLHMGLSRICVRCMNSVPLDAPKQAQRRKSLLWLHHVMQSKISWLVLAIIIAIGLVIKYGHFPNALYIPLDLFSSAYLYALWSHHKLQPWCPFCKDWGDGGMREPSPDPVEKVEA